VTTRHDDALVLTLTTVAPELLSYLQRRVGFDDAPDLLGETMIVAWRRVTEFPRRPEEARMWLFGIARGTLLNYARGERRRWALVDRLRGRADSAASSPGADEGLDMRDAIDRLATDDRELIRLVHWEKLTIAEAAAVLGVPPSTARSRYARAKDELRAALQIEIGARNSG
jgi:RNA polymerase sigma factor (sigma-70 family)